MKISLTELKDILRTETELERYKAAVGILRAERKVLLETQKKLKDEIIALHKDDDETRAKVEAIYQQSESNEARARAGLPTPPTPPTQ